MLETKRKLASIQKIEKTWEIVGADSIEGVKVLGWELVAGKGEFKVGDSCVYFEIDSQLPIHEVFAFMESRKYRVKTAKFLKVQISQGLALPLSILSKFTDKDVNSLKVGDDVTDIIGVTKYEPRPEDSNPNIKKMHPLRKKLRNYAIYRLIDSFIFPKKTSGNFPTFIPKTDEERLQSIPSILTNNLDQMVYATEKLDGSSATFFYNKNLDKKRFGIFPIDKGNGFGVCSRNLRLVHDNNSNWWKIAHINDMERKLREISKIIGNIAIQGEIVGEGIQKNKYKLKGIDFYCYGIFNIDTQKYLSYHERKHICEMFNIKTVPFIETFTINNNVDWFIDFATRQSVIGSKPLAEGVVVRLVENESISFKVISPKWLLKNDE